MTTLRTLFVLRVDIKMIKFVKNKEIIFLNALKYVYNYTTIWQKFPLENSIQLDNLWSAA